jgi:hypothetical protein
MRKAKYHKLYGLALSILVLDHLMQKGMLAPKK